jgi:hypothetical protein
MKHEWRKKEKGLYLPKKVPVQIQVPEFHFFTIKGKGNPNDDFFPEYIGVLYSLAYTVKMSPKKGLAPEGYFDYTVYPLEGVWDISAEAKNSATGGFTKDDLVFKLMIRQPDFVDEAFAESMIAQTKVKKPHELLEQVKFERITEGHCVQMMHLGPYDDEPESFQLMEDFAAKENLLRLSKKHREIYLNDARKTAPEKLKTVLRFQVKGK